MPRRRKNDDFEALALPLAAFIFLFGAAVLAFLRTILLIGVILAGAAVVVAIAIYVGRALWRRQTDIESFLPDINWEVPLPASRFRLHSGGFLVNVIYPSFPESHSPAPPHVIGTSGAWKDVLVKTAMIAPLTSASTPRELKERVAACELASKDVFAQAFTRLSESVRQNLDQHLREIDQMAESADVLRQRVRPKLDELEDSIAALTEGNYFERIKARRLSQHFAEYHAMLLSRCAEIRAEADQQRERLNQLVKPAERERIVAKQLEDDLAMMKAILDSNELAGAAAEMEVIEELSRMDGEVLIFNDVKLEAPEFIRFEGKPLMSAQIDTLVITPAAVFVLEVKNWSRRFAKSGEGFDPFEQVSRASYLVYRILQEVGIVAKTKAVIVTNGHLPEKGDRIVAVVPVSRIKTYIQGFGSGYLNVDQIRAALDL
ncbi:MAG TPA: NERD domain-containing protein [Pyrinomonadaceae bacterium]|nr:NERD domain-containing protein [Pyrinomonadaceae bacterium]